MAASLAGGDGGQLACYDCAPTGTDAIPGCHPSENGVKIRFFPIYESRVAHQTCVVGMHKSLGVNAVVDSAKLHWKMSGLCLFLAAAVTGASASDIEPRSYTNVPVGLNYLVAGYTYTQGGVGFSPALSLANGNIKIHSTFLSYVRSLDIWGRSGKFAVVIPEASLSGQADIDGEPRKRVTSGFGDPAVKLSVNLYGAPALPSEQFESYRQDTIVGASVAVTAPGGQYDPKELVNLGTNRWTFKPDIGVSKKWGAFTTEISASALFFSDNTDYLQGKLLQQAPIYSFQGHAIYNFAPEFWCSLDANYYFGGGTFTDHTDDANRQQNWHVGGNLEFAVNRQNTVKLFGYTGVYARTGNNYDNVGVAWEYRWGGGL